MKKSFSLTSALAIVSSLISVAQSRECSILHVYGANGKVGAGFGVINDGSIPRTGNSGDAGADATSFAKTENPNPACGSVAKVHGNVVDIPTFVQQAEQDGLPTVYSNGSIPLKVFIVNRGGGGPMTCQYSSDATGHNWADMDVTLNIPGNFGLYNVVRKQFSAVATFKSGSHATGGANKDVALVRCRAGESNQCGGCFAVKLDGTVTRSDAASAAASASSGSSSALSLTSQQMSAIVAKVIDAAQQQHIVAA